MMPVFICLGRLKILLKNILRSVTRIFLCLKIIMFIRVQVEGNVV